MLTLPLLLSAYILNNRILNSTGLGSRTCRHRPSRPNYHRTVCLQAHSQPHLQNTKFYKHILAILTVPRTSVDRIANEAILETCMKHAVTTKSNSPAHAHAHGARISVVLRRQDGDLPKLNELRGYVGEVYSMAWDCALGLDSPHIHQMNSTKTSDSYWNTKAENNRGQILDVIGRCSIFRWHLL